MPISLTCPQCSRRHQAPDALAGRQAKCGCGAVIAVPARAVAVRASGAWQASAVPQAAAPPMGDSSVWGEVSSADLNRTTRPPAPAAAVLEGPALTPAGSITGELIQRARHEAAERKRTQAEQLPHYVSLAIAGLAVPGAMALAAGFGSLLALGSNLVEDYGSEFLIFLFVVGVLLAALDISAAAMIYLRVPFSRTLGYAAAGVTMLTGCANPVNFICAILTLWFLSMPETGEYLRRKGAPGVIDW